MTTPSSLRQIQEAKHLEGALRRLLRRHNADDIFAELNHLVTENKEALAKPGRPVFFDANALMEVWLYVRENVERTGLSVYEVCKRGSFTWYQGGGTDGPAQLKSIQDTTLRRRYQSAATFLRQDAEIWWFLEQARLRGRGEPLRRSLSPLESWWHRALADRLGVPVETFGEQYSVQNFRYSRSIGM